MDNRSTAKNAWKIQVEISGKNLFAKMKTKCDKRKTAFFLGAVFLFVGGYVNALQDVNVTVDSYYDICLTENFINETCNITQVLTLEGTQDHFLYFTPKTYISDDMNNLDKLKAIIEEPIYMFLGFGVLVVMMASVYMIFIFLRRLYHGD